MFIIGSRYSIGFYDEMYLFIDYHHKIGNPNKSWWIANLVIEGDLFHEMTKNGFHENGKGYNVLINSGKIQTLGTDIFSNDLKIAIFRQGIDEWHGYPGNHKVQKDKPTSQILDKLSNNGVSLSIIRKIKKGQSI